MASTFLHLLAHKPPLAYSVRFWPTAATYVLAVSMTTLTPGQTMAATDKPAPILTERDTDALRLMPPPPAPGSSDERTEVAELHAIQAGRTPAELAHALDSGQHEEASIFASVLGPKFDLSRLPATARLMAQVRADDSAAVKRAKAIFRRRRPWVVDPTIVGCPHGDNKPLSSYPSGHSTMIFAAATVLVDLVPERGQALMAFAKGFAHDRLICGHHFQSDVVSGEVFGTVIGADLLHTPALQANIADARAELKTAGLTTAP